MTSEITWTGSHHDQVSRNGKYFLRAEKVGLPLWRWIVLFEKNDIAGMGDTLTEEQAKTACEKAYYEHLNQGNK